MRWFLVLLLSGVLTGSYSGVVGAGAAGVECWPKAVDPRRLAAGQHDALGSPAISGNVVVWADKRSGNWDIYGYDLGSRTEFPIATNPADQVSPAISGKVVVWADKRNGNWDIYGYDLSSRSEFAIVTDPADQTDPTVSDGLVAWSDKRNWKGFYQGGIDIYGFDLTARVELPLVTEPGDKAGPRLSGGRLVYRQATLHGVKFAWGDLISLDLVTKAKRVIGEPPIMGPADYALAGDWAVWQDFARGLHLQNLATGEETLLENAGGIGPTVEADGLAVWSASDFRLKAFDSASWIRFDVAPRGALPAVSERNLVWVETSAERHTIIAARLATPGDCGIPNGHFYTQTNGRSAGASPLGYGVANDPQARLWDDFKRLGGVAEAGYPASKRFVWGGFVSQVMQKEVFQWRPEVGQVYFVNVFDELSKAGKDDWLLAFKNVPKSFDWSGDAGLPWGEVVQRHIAILDNNPAIKARYFAVDDPVLPRGVGGPTYSARYGLPMSYQDFGTFFVVRTQRAVFQQWKVDMPWAKAGDVVIANGGDVAKEAGLIPEEAMQPEPPPAF